MGFYVRRLTIPVYEFTSTSSDPEDGDGLMFLWDFDDGAVAMQAKTTHTFSRAGSFQVSLIVWDTEGRSARYTKTIVQ